MLGHKINQSRGDTLIEVLFAVAVFSLVAVGGVSIMNQGLDISQRALEITLVRQEIDAQAEGLRFMNDSYVAAYQPGVVSYPANTPAGQWALMQASVISTGATSASAFGGTTCLQPLPKGSFIINTRNATFDGAAGVLQSAQIFSKVQYDDTNNVTSAQGIWIEAILTKNNIDLNQANTDYIDFHIRACWYSPGQTVPVTLGTIVRLYEPRG